MFFLIRGFFHTTIFDMQEYLLSDIGHLLDSLIIIWKKVGEND